MAKKLLEEVVKKPLATRNKLIKATPLAKAVMKIDSKNPASKVRKSVIGKVKSFLDKK